MLRRLALTCLFLLTGCTDSDNVSWVIVSNPSAGTVPVPGGLVISWRYSSKNFGIISGAQDSSHPVAFRLEETGGPRGDDPTMRRTIYLGIDNDHLLILQSGRAEYHSPSLLSGKVDLPSVVAVAAGPDSATALRITAGTSIWHLAAAGNVIVEDSASGVFVTRPDKSRQPFPFGSEIEPVGKDYHIVESGGRRTLISVPRSAPIGSQAEFDPTRGAYRFFSYAGQMSAELPARQFKVFDGSNGIRMEGEFPGGAGGALDGAFRAVLASRNHHLLLIRAGN